MFKLSSANFAHQSRKGRNFSRFGRVHSVNFLTVPFISSGAELVERRSRTPIEAASGEKYFNRSRGFN